MQFLAKIAKGFLSLCSKLPEAIASSNENNGIKPEKKTTKYNQRILNGENGFFTSLVFTNNSGMSTETKYYRRLSQQLIEKSDASYSDTKLKKITTEMTKINPQNVNINLVMSLQTFPYDFFN